MDRLDASCPRKSRLAPSPTGALHLGNARTFLLNWLLARQNGWKILLRVEDLDGPRVKAGADRQALDDLRWLGLDWDEGPVYQSARADAYRRAIEALLAAGAAYPCACSRKEVDRSASAPHAEDGAAVYPGTCRGRFASVQEAREATGRPPAIRFRVPLGTVDWLDEFRGPQACDAARDLGDFVIAKVAPDARPGVNPGGVDPADVDPGRRRSYQAAYQLAVVVDDAEAGVTDVVRGDDLVDSTPRQLLLYRALGSGGRAPHYWHLPLVVGPDGRRLAKRHGDTRLSFYRDRGAAPGRVLALLARWSGTEGAGDSVDMRELLDRFRLDRVPKDRAVFGAADDVWLRGS